MVLVGEVCSKIFDIHNNSNSTWDFARVRSSCSCTTSKISSERIEPGQSATIDVTFHAGLKPHLFNTWTLCEFRQQESPVVRLSLTGEVCEPLMAEPAVLNLSSTSSEKRIMSSFAVHNYQKCLCDTLEVTSGQSWIVLNMANADAVDAHQSWNVGISVDTKLLRFGKTTALLDLTCTNRAKHTHIRKTVPLVIEKRSLITSVPKAVFFGDITLTEVDRIRKQLTLIPATTARDNNRDIEISTDSSEIDVGYIRRDETTGGSIYAVQLKHKPLSDIMQRDTQDDIFVNANIIARLSGDPAAAMTIPVSARVTNGN